MCNSDTTTPPAQLLIQGQPYTIQPIRPLPEGCTAAWRLRCTQC
jgi:hypothetical protein